MEERGLKLSRFWPFHFLGPFDTTELKMHKARTYIDFESVASALQSCYVLGTGRREAHKKTGTSLTVCLFETQ